jgi:ATP-dependent DNA helicase Rep
VTLATLHALKGLQFKVVIMAGVNEGLLPLYGDARRVQRHELLEELRLMHVGMTRAQDVLILVFTQTRERPDKRIEKAQPSRFLSCLQCKLSRYQPINWQNLLQPQDAHLQETAEVMA